MIDQGEGSGATVTRIMSGAYDAGFGDVNAIIQNASTKPQDAPVMVYTIGTSRRCDRDQEDQRHQHHQGFRGPYAGRRAGYADHAAAAGVRAKEQAGGREDQISNTAPNLQEPMLIKGDIDAALVFNITSDRNLVPNREDPDKDYNGSSSAMMA